LAFRKSVEKLFNCEENPKGVVNERPADETYY